MINSSSFVSLLLLSLCTLASALPRNNIAVLFSVLPPQQKHSNLNTAALTAPGHCPLEHFAVQNAVLDLDQSITITANITTTTYDEKGGWIQVSWSGVALPTFDDYIALYPDGADVTTTAPIKFKLAIPTTTSTNFRLINYRQPLRFAFLRGGLQFPRVAAWSDRIEPARPNAPLHGHLSLTKNPTEMAVQFSTRDKPVNLLLEYWPTENPSNKTFIRLPVDDQSSITYSKDQMCGYPANSTGWFDPGYLHYLIMSNLSYATRYSYRYGATFLNEEAEWSDETSFMSTPSPNSEKEQEITILATADLGQAEIDGSLELSQMWASLGTTDAIKTENATLLIHNGDTSYARGYGSQWYSYWHQINAITRSMPYMTVPGNHERDWPGTGDRFGYSYDSGGECGVVYEKQLKMPAAGVDQPWYSFNYGPIHFLQYSTEHDFSVGSAQYTFIAADLATINKTETPWVIVGGHRPMYLDSVSWSPLVPNEDQIVAADLRNALEDLFLEHQVDVTWHGHHHSYQRTCAVAHGKCVFNTSKGIVHVVLGHGGAGLSPNIHLFKPRIFKKVVLRHGYVKVVANKTHLYHQSIATDSLYNCELDEFMLVK